MCAAVISDDGLRPSPICLNSFKSKDFLADSLSSGGTLSPDIKAASFVPNFVCVTETSKPSVELVGQYLLVEKLTVTGTVDTYKAVHIGSKDEFICKVFPLNKYRDILSPYFHVGHHPHIAQIVEVVLGPTLAYVILPRPVEDLHAYVRRRRGLKEREASRLFGQIVSAIKRCHGRGIVLRDLKLRKFVFIDQQRTHLVLESLEDAFLLADLSDDLLTDKHGCPAYVSPEILSSTRYSGRPADLWSLGVILYTMLFGQYPFHDTVASQLFGKIRRGHYSVPDSVSAHARCLIRSLLRTDPADRLTAGQAAKHPWFEGGKLGGGSSAGRVGMSGVSGGRGAAVRESALDQLVPEITVTQSMTSSDFFIAS